MMVSESTIEPVMLDVHLQAEDFYRDRHRTIYEAIIRLNENADPVDVLTVAEALSQHGELDEVGGRDVISSLAARVPAPGSAKHYAKIVKQNSLMRRLDAAAKTIQQSVAERDGEPSDLVEQAERLLFQVAHQERAVDFREHRGDPPRRDRQARGARERHRLRHGHPLGLPRPRRQDRRVPAGQPDRDRGEAGDGEKYARLRLRRRTWR